MKTPIAESQKRINVSPLLDLFEESISNRAKSADKYRYQKIESQIQSQGRGAILCLAPETIALISPHSLESFK